MQSNPLGDLLGGGQPAPVQAMPQPSANPLDDIFGGSAPAQPAPMAPQPSGGLDDIFGGGAAMAAPTPAPAQVLFNAFEDASIKIEFSFQRKNTNEHLIKALYTNKQMVPLTGVALQVAVQGYMKI